MWEALLAMTIVRCASDNVFFGKALTDGASYGLLASMGGALLRVRRYVS